MKKILFVSALIVIAATAQAVAPKFSDTDTNQDGVITMEEWVAQHKIINPKFTLKQVSRFFKTRDKNGDGQLTPDELP